MGETICGLETATFFVITKQRFGFLLEDYNFSVIAEESSPAHSSRVLVFRGKNLCIEVSHERIAVGVFLYPSLGGKRHGFSIGGLATFLDYKDGKPVKELEEGRFGPEFDEMLDDRVKIVEGLAWYASLLQLYLDRILPLFEKETFERIEPELVEWRKLWQKQIGKAISRYIDERKRKQGNRS